MSRRPGSSSVVQKPGRSSVQSGGSMTPDVWTDSPDGQPIYAVDQHHHRDGYELVRTAPQPHGLVALLYRRAPLPEPQPEPPPLDPWADTTEDQPWEQDELPAGLETLSERVQALPPDARARFAELTPAQRDALGFPDAS